MQPDKGILEHIVYDFELPVLTHPARTLSALRVSVQSDKDILEHIVYDFEDHEMMEALRPSIEEAQPIHSQQLALDYIGKRASQV